MKRTLAETLYGGWLIGLRILGRAMDLRQPDKHLSAQQLRSPSQHLSRKNDEKID
jgi:hypothetical protein